MIVFRRLFSVLYITSFFLFLLSVPIFAQEKGLVFSKYYSTKDYKASTQNWAIAQDKRGILYFGNASGILEFDGETWRLIRVTNKSSVRSLAFDSNEILYVGAFNELGYLLPDHTGDLKYYSLIPLIDQQYSDFGDIWDINCFSDTVFFLTDNYIFRYHNGKFSYWQNENERYYLSHKVNNQYLVQEIGKGLMKFSEDSFHLIKKGEFFTNIRIHTILPLEDNLLICTRNNGLFLYNSEKGGYIQSLSQISPKAKTVNNYFIENSFYHGVELSDNLFAFGSIMGDIMVLDRNWNVVDIINEGSIGIKSPPLYLHFQNNHSLWLALANGISQIEVMSPYRYWNEEKGLSGVITDVARLKNVLYISTGTGIFYTRGADQDEFSLTTFKPVEGSFEQAWGFLYFKPSGYQIANQNNLKNTLGYNEKDETILLAATSVGVFQITDSKSSEVANYNGVFTLYQSKSNPSNLLIGFSKGVALASYEKGNWVDHGMQYEIDAQVRNIGEDSLGNIWISARYKGLFRIKNPFEKIIDSIKVELYDTTHGLPSVNQIQIFEERDNLIFRCENQNYSFCPLDNQFKVFVHPPVTDSSSAAGLQYYDTLSLKRVIDDIISYTYVTYHHDSVFWFSTNAGIVKHMGGTTRNFFDLPPTLIRKVISEDSILFNGTNYHVIINENGSECNYVSPEPSVDLGTVLKYKSNSLTVYFSFPFFEGEKKNFYSYFLDGYDNGWSEWSTETKKEYTNLREGNYTFKVKSKNLYEIESDHAEFSFTILPPWYRTYLAYFGYLTLFIVFLILVVKFYTYRLIKEKDKLEGIVKERTQEILMQKEEILVQSEHLRETYDWMRAKNIELEYQKKAFEKKKDQLEISNATKNKFFRIIAHDLRNPISTLVSSTGYILTDIEKFDKVKMKRIIEELNKLSLTTYNLLENLLDWSTSQMGEIKFDPKKVELISVVRENIELVKSNIDSKNIHIDISVPEDLSVLADENMVHNIVRNLITNAVKFTPDNGLIRVFTEVNDDYCSLNIADNGIGISKENLENLFRIDKHVSTPGTHNEKGSGLGLILCKEFVERNGGTISVTSELEKGSTFTISFKLA